MSSAAELGEAGEEDRAEGRGEAKQDLHDEQGPGLAVVGGHMESAGCGVRDLAGDDEDLVQVLGAELAQREREIGEGGHHREIGGLEVGGRGVRDPGQHRDHRDLTERRFERGVDQRDEARVHYSAGVRGGPLVQAVVHAEDGQRQHKANKGQEADHIGDRALGYEAAEDEHPGERERACDQR